MKIFILHDTSFLKNLYCLIFSTSILSGNAFELNRDKCFDIFVDLAEAFDTDIGIAKCFTEYYPICYTGFYKPTRNNKKLV